MGAEAARQGSPLRETFTKGVRATIDVVAGLVAGKSRRARRQRARAIYASMIGALVVARAVDDAELSEEVLQSELASIVHADSSA